MWLLTRCAPHYRRDSFLGDLWEQYEERGSCWYWRQVFAAARLHVLSQLVSSHHSDVPVAEFICDLVMTIALVIFAANELPVYAVLFLSGTSLSKSDLSTTIVSGTMGATVLGAVILARGIRRRAIPVG
jgi:hypothetical protein